MTHRIQKCLYGVGLLWLTVAGNTQAADLTWLPTSGANAWNAPANWSTGALPTGSDTAYFNNTGTQTVNVTGGIGAGKPSNITVASTGGGILTFDKTVTGDVNILPGSTITLGNGNGDQIVVANSSGAGAFNFYAQNAGNFNVGGTNATVTATGAGVTVGSVSGYLVMRAGGGNTLLVENKATARGNGLLIGDAPNINNITLKVSGIGSTLNNFTRAIQLGGDNAHDDAGTGNSLTIENGAALNSTGDFLLRAGTLILDSGTINLNAKALTMSTATSRFEADGTLTAAKVTSSTDGAATAIGGDHAFGMLNATLSDATTGWDNHHLSLQLELGDLTDSPVAGTDYDFLNIAGVFTLGGNLQIDLSNAMLPDGDDFSLKLIGWSSYSGAPDDLSVAFIGGSPLGYKIESDGLYIQAVPEPSAAGLLLISGGLLAAGMRTRRTVSRQSAFRLARG